MTFVALVMLGCRSSAPYSVASAAVNTGLALGVAAQERAAGGCYAVCTAGTVCNPKTGYCERQPFEPCLRGTSGCEPGPKASLNLDHLVGKPESAVAPSIGVSPETGRAPAPPGSPPSEGPP